MCVQMMPNGVYAGHMMSRRSPFNNADFCHEGRQERWVILSNYIRIISAQTPIRVKKFFNTSSTLSARKSEPSCSQYALSYLFLSSYFFYHPTLTTNPTPVRIDPSPKLQQRQQVLTQGLCRSSASKSSCWQLPQGSGCAFCTKSTEMGEVERR